MGDSAVDIRAMFEDVPEVSEVLEEMRKNSTDLETDPEFVAGYLKARFVEDIYQFMAARGMKKSDLAKLLGKSDQYVGRVLNEQANFTLESIAEFACVLGMRVALTMYRPGEEVVVQPRTYGPDTPADSVPVHKVTPTARGTGGAHGEHFVA